MLFSCLHRKHSYHYISNISALTAVAARIYPLGILLCRIVELQGKLDAMAVVEPPQAAASGILPFPVIDNFFDCIHLYFSTSCGLIQHTQDTRHSLVNF